jgi:PAP2 superfamily
MPLLRFSLTAFLSGLGASLQPTNPGGGRRGGSLMPTNPGGGRRGGSLTPTNPPGGEWSPTNPGDDWSPTNPGDDWSPTNPGEPAHWEGIDPPWVYHGERPLLAQAIRKTRAKVLRLSDPPEPGAAPRRRTGPPAHEEAELWRWAPEFRVTAVAAEMMSRVHVHDRSVQHVQAAASGSRLARQRLFSVPTEAEFQRVDWADQRDKVIRAAVEREDRLPEILSQTSDLWPFFESVCGVQLARAPAFAELLSAGNEWALHLLMLLKHRVAQRRPGEMSTLVVPVIRTPGHGSMPSGHATMAAFTATLLTLMMYGPASPRARVLDRLARRIAFNRVVAGVHFPVDNAVGYHLGRQLAHTLCALATGGPLPAPPALDLLLQQPSFDLKEDQEDLSMPVSTKTGCDAAPAISTLWARAQIEINRLRV